MDGERFDRLTRLVAGVGSRRNALRLAAAGALGTLAAGVLVEEAAAKPTCPKRAGCNKLCRGTNKLCICVKTVGGKRVCVHPCCTDRTCTSAQDCESGEVCMKTTCCGDESVCVTKCTEPAPDPESCVEPQSADSSAARERWR